MPSRRNSLSIKRLRKIVNIRRRSVGGAITNCEIKYKELYEYLLAEKLKIENIYGTKDNFEELLDFCIRFKFNASTLTINNKAEPLKDIIIACASDKHTNINTSSVTNLYYINQVLVFLRQNKKIVGAALKLYDISKRFTPVAAPYQAGQKDYAAKKERFDKATNELDDAVVDLQPHERETVKIAVRDLAYVEKLSAPGRIAAEKAAAAAEKAAAEAKVAAEEKAAAEAKVAAEEKAATEAKEAAEKAVAEAKVAAIKAAKNKADSDAAALAAALAAQAKAAAEVKEATEKAARRQATLNANTARRAFSASEKAKNASDAAAKIVKNAEKAAVLAAKRKQLNVESEAAIKKEGSVINPLKRSNPFMTPAMGTPGGPAPPISQQMEAEMAAYNRNNLAARKGYQNATKAATRAFSSSENTINPMLNRESAKKARNIKNKTAKNSRRQQNIQILTRKFKNIRKNAIETAMNITGNNMYKASEILTSQIKTSQNAINEVARKIAHRKQVQNANIARRAFSKSEANKNRAAAATRNISETAVPSTAAIGLTKGVKPINIRANQNANIANVAQAEETKNPMIAKKAANAKIAAEKEAARNISETAVPSTAAIGLPKGESKPINISANQRAKNIANVAQAEETKNPMIAKKTTKKNKKSKSGFLGRFFAPAFPKGPSGKTLTRKNVRNISGETTPNISAIGIKKNIPVNTIIKPKRSVSWWNQQPTQPAPSSSANYWRVSSTTPDKYTVKHMNQGVLVENSKD